MLASTYSISGLTMMLLLVCAALAALWVMSLLFRAKMTGVLVIGFGVMMLAGAAFLLAGAPPQKRQGSRTPQTVSKAPDVAPPLISLEAGPLTVEQYIDTARIHGQVAAEIAKEKIQIGAEALTDAAHRITGETKALVRDHRIQIPPMPPAATRVVQGVRHDRPAGLAASGLMALAIGALLYLGYIFLDASTRGHFTWSLRFVAVLTFAALCAALFFLRYG